MSALVTVVICSLLVPPTPSLRDAARLSGLPLRRAVPIARVPPSRYDALRNLEYPRVQRDARGKLYDLLGLPARSATSTRTAWYDPARRRVLVRRGSVAPRRVLLHELVRALIDQSFNLRRLRTLRARDHDRALAAEGIVEGAAALASRLSVGPGRGLAYELRQIGGRAAVNSALRTFPQTTEQLLHVDKFLERERPLPLRLPATAGGAHLGFSETFGELDVRNLLQAFRIRGASEAAAGWGAGRAALYGDAAVVVLRWDSLQDALEWRAAVAAYIVAAFPDAPPRACPPLDGCWADVAAGVVGRTSVLAAGPGAETVAAALLRQL